MQPKAKLHTTNYYNTLIEIADDCPARAGEIPPIDRSAKAIAQAKHLLPWSEWGSGPIL